MNSLLISAFLLGSLAFINAGAQQFPGLASMLRKYDLASARNLAMKENSNDYAHEAEEKDDIVEEVKNALLGSMLEGEGSLLAAAMEEEDENEAVAQFRFIKRIVNGFNKFRQTRLGKQLEQGIKARLCQQPEK